MFHFKFVIIIILLNFFPLFGNINHNNDYFNQSSRFKFGIYMGMIAASEYGYDAKEKDYKVGYTCGISAIKRIADNFHFRFGMYYSQKGYRNRVDTGNDNNREITIYSLHSNYFELPVGVQFYMPINQYNLNWFFGICPAYNIDALTKTKKLKVSTYTKIDTINKVDFGVFAGTSFMLSNSFALDIITNIGLNSIIDTPNPPSLKNITFSLLLGYFI